MLGALAPAAFIDNGR